MIGLFGPLILGHLHWVIVGNLQTRIRSGLIKRLINVHGCLGTGADQFRLGRRLLLLSSGQRLLSYRQFLERCILEGIAT